jgi:hypothetical protein
MFIDDVPSACRLAPKARDRHLHWVPHAALTFLSQHAVVAARVDRPA